MTEHVLLNGVSHSDRHGVISSVTEAIQAGGGWIEDVYFFSNVAVNLRCAAMPTATVRLMEVLSRIGLGLTPADTTDLVRAAAALPDGEELRFSLQITFVHDEPDLVGHIPSVPG